MDDDIEMRNNRPLFNPFNAVNKQITQADVEALLQTYGLPPVVNNVALYQRACTHSSYCVRHDLPADQIAECPVGCVELQPISNERLEFLGDGVLECVTKWYMYQRFPHENEGFMTEKKIALVKNEAIGKLAYDIGLAQWLVISKHSELKKSRSNLKKLGCLFEAFLGALFLDNHERFDAVRTFVVAVFERHIDWQEIILNDDNYKNILQIKLQKEFKTTPEYLVLSHTVKGYHTGVFLCIGQPIYNASTAHAVHVKDFDTIHAYLRHHKQALFLLGGGTHKIKKKSEQLACENALKLLK